MFHPGINESFSHPTEDHDMLLPSLIMTLVATVQAAVKPAAPPPANAPRTWHVAPEELKGIPPAIQLRTISAAAAKAEPGDTRRDPLRRLS